MKENAAWALGYIGKHNEHLAGLVVDAGTLPLLILAFQEPEISLKQVILILQWYYKVNIIENTYALE